MHPGLYIPNAGIGNYCSLVPATNDRDVFFLGFHCPIVSCSKTSVTSRFIFTQILIYQLFTSLFEKIINEFINSHRQNYGDH